ADPVLAMHPVDKQIGRAILRDNGQESAAPLIGISVREWKDWSHFKLAIAHAADRMIEELGVRVVFIPMQWPDDLSVSKKIAGRMKYKAAVLSGEYTTSELLSLVGNLDLLIGIRLHALIFAAVMQVPMAGISYDPKIERFLKMIGERHVGTLKTVDAESLMEKVRSLWKERKQPNSERQARINTLRNRAFQNAELALELIEKKGR
ncbi:MAG: polysaccharide pyruvyl transferase family protein, partial [Sporomusa sp.]